MQTLEDVLKFTGGAEEEKEEWEFSPEEYQNRDSMDYNNNADGEGPDVGDEKGFRAQLEEFSRLFFGSCGNLLESAFFFTRDKGCNVHGPSTPRGGAYNHNNHGQDAAAPATPALSIADELRRLAAREGPVLRPRAADIPRFLGEDAVYSFEDDNVSAISQHTLEEMARKGFVHPMCRRNNSNDGSLRSPPSPIRTRSSTSSRSEEKRQHP